MPNIENPATAVKETSPCPCPDCTEIRRLDALAARLGMAGPTIDPDTIHWSQVGPYHVPLPTEGPAEVEAVGPAERDDAWRLDTFELEGGCRGWDLSPEEEEIELYGETAWKRAIREMEEDEAERQYDRLIDTLGGFPAGW